MIRKILWIAAVLVLLTLTAACQSSSGPAIQVEDIWGRPSPQVATNGAFYMRIRNTSAAADRLLSAASSACTKIELHETTMMDDVMQMAPVESVEIPAGQTVELKVGGLHLMCIDKLEDFAQGAKYNLVLQFETSGELTVEAEIREP